MNNSKMIRPNQIGKYFCVAILLFSAFSLAQVTKRILSTNDYPSGLPKEVRDYIDTPNFKKQDENAVIGNLESARDLWEMGQKEEAVKIYASTLGNLNHACVASRSDGSGTLGGGSTYACNVRDSVRIEALQRIQYYQEDNSPGGWSYNLRALQQKHDSRCDSFRNKHLGIFADFDCN